MSKSNRPLGGTGLGPLISDRRHQLSLSRAQVARRASIDTSVIHRIEVGERQHPDPRTLEGLAAALDLPLADLYIGAGYALPFDLPSFSSYVRARYGLPEETINSLRDYLGYLVNRQRSHASTLNRRKETRLSQP